MIARKVLLSFGARLGTSALAYLGLFFVARYMGAEALGVIGFGFAYVGFFNFLADLGFGAAHIKKVSEGKDLGQCIGTYTLIKSVLTAGMIATALGGLFVYKTVLDRTFESPAQVYVICIAIATLALYDLGAIISHTFAARRETAKQTLSDVTIKITEVALKIVVALAGLGVIMLAAASWIGAFAGMLVLLVLFRGTRIARPNWTLVKDYTAFALPVMLIVTSNAVVDNLDKIMIQGFRDTTTLGLYVAASRIAAVLWLAKIAVDALVFPTISALHSKQDIRGIRSLSHRAERYLSLILLPVGVLVTAYGQGLMLILGPEFRSAGLIMALLVWAVILSVISVPYANQIIGTNHARISAMLSILLMILNTGLNLVLIPTRIGPFTLAGLGAHGAALATLIASLFMAGIYRVFAFRITATPPNPRLLKHLLAAAAMGASICAANLLLTPHAYAWRLVGAPVSIMVYLGVLLSVRELTRMDIAYFRRMFSASAMQSYVLSELGRKSKAGTDKREDEP